MVEKTLQKVRINCQTYSGRRWVKLSRDLEEVSAFQNKLNCKVSFSDKNKKSEINARYLGRVAYPNDEKET